MAIRISQFAFHISQYQYVTLKIYDVQGREVAVVMNEKLLAGEHMVRVDMTGLPVGVYFLNVTAGEKTSTQKLIIKH